MEKMRPWVKDSTVFAGFILLDAALIGIAYWATPRCGPIVPLWLECWWWAFGAPVCVADRYHCSVEWMWRVFWVNPFIYGLIWWATWRMYRLIRSKPADGVSPPPHTE